MTNIKQTKKNQIKMFENFIIKNSTFDFDLPETGVGKEFLINSQFSNLSFTHIEIDNDYFQHEIINEVRRNNSKTELWHHYFSVFGTLFSIFGILGNLISIYVLLKPIRFNHSSQRRRGRHWSASTTIDYRLISFYSYLTALSFCDLFSCIFAILNVLEYLLPHYLEMNSTRYHEFCLSIQIYTHPIATTLQALSCWLICAFSIHRCKSIAESTDVFSLFKKRSLLFRNDLKIFRSVCGGLGSVLCARKNRRPLSTDQEGSKSIYEMTKDDMPARVKPKANCCVVNMSQARIVIIILYIFSIIYLIPQWFEKRLTYRHIHSNVYVFTDITEFGQSKMYRQIFHLWFYLLFIYFIPFMLILVFNLILLKAFLDSKKKCERYKLRNDANSIIKDFNSIEKGGNIITPKRITSLSSGINEMRHIICSSELKMLKPDQFVTPRQSVLSEMTAINLKRLPTTRHKSTSLGIINKNKALTLTLFGVVLIFFICHFPAAITKIIYVLYPKMEFESTLVSFFLGLSNFLIMLNSSINWLLYIVFGPGKFRQEFSNIFFRVLKCFTCGGRPEKQEEEEEEEEVEEEEEEEKLSNNERRAYMHDKLETRNNRSSSIKRVTYYYAENELDLSRGGGGRKVSSYALSSNEPNALLPNMNAAKEETRGILKETSVREIEFNDQD